MDREQYALKYRRSHARGALLVVALALGAFVPGAAARWESLAWITWLSLVPLLICGAGSILGRRYNGLQSQYVAYALWYLPVGPFALLLSNSLTAVACRFGWIPVTLRAARNCVLSRMTAVSERLQPLCNRTKYVLQPRAPPLV